MYVYGLRIPAEAVVTKMTLEKKCMTLKVAVRI